MIKKDPVFDTFVEDYCYIRNRGWKEADGFGEPFQMVHPLYEGVFSIEEAVKIEKDVEEFELQN